MHAVAAGQRHVAALLASPELAQGRDGGRVARVGAAMARLVHCKAALLLLSDVRQSATRAAVWRAQQCLQVPALPPRRPPACLPRPARRAVLCCAVL